VLAHIGCGRGLRTGARRRRGATRLGCGLCRAFFLPRALADRWRARCRGPTTRRRAPACGACAGSACGRLRGRSAGGRSGPAGRARSGPPVRALHPCGPSLRDLAPTTPPSAASAGHSGAGAAARRCGSSGPPLGSAVFARARAPDLPRCAAPGCPTDPPRRPALSGAWRRPLVAIASSSSCLPAPACPLVPQRRASALFRAAIPPVGCARSVGALSGRLASPHGASLCRLRCPVRLSCVRAPACAHRHWCRTASRRRCRGFCGRLFGRPCRLWRAGSCAGFSPDAPHAHRLLPLRRRVSAAAGTGAFDGNDVLPRRLFPRGWPAPHASVPSSVPPRACGLLGPSRGHASLGGPRNAASPVLSRGVRRPGRRARRLGRPRRRRRAGQRARTYRLVRP